jgi:hypothetical protein
MARVPCAVTLALGLVLAVAPASARPYANDIEGAFARFGHEMAQIPRSFERLGHRPTKRHKAYRGKRHRTHHRRNWLDLHLHFGF